MTGRKRWMAAVIAETKKQAPALTYTRQARQVRMAKGIQDDNQAPAKAA